METIKENLILRVYRAYNIVTKGYNFENDHYFWGVLTEIVEDIESEDLASATRGIESLEKFHLFTYYKFNFKYATLPTDIVVDVPEDIYSLKTMIEQYEVRY